MSQVVSADVPQAGRFAQSVPDFVDGGVGLTGSPVDEYVQLALGVQPVQHTDGAVIQRHGTHLARLAIGRRDAPDPLFDNDVLPFCLQRFIESCPGAQQKQNDVAHRAIAVRVQNRQQLPKLCGIQVILDQVFLLVILDAHHGVFLDDFPLNGQVQGPFQKLRGSGCRWRATVPPRAARNGTAGCPCG